MEERKTREVVEEQRWEILDQIDDWLELPMAVLGFVWLALLVVELIWSDAPGLETASTVIWILFIVDFLIRMALAPRKLAYVRRNWLTVIALALPALRVFRLARALRALRAARGLRLVRIVTSLNRGMRSLGRTMRRRGFGYVVALTVIVTLAGGAGMYAFENRPGGRGLDSYGEALWWTAMLMTTMGSEYWPQSPEGRVLCLFLAVYAFAVFGYVTATLATFFIGQDAQSPEAEVAGQGAVEGLRVEIAALREEIRRLTAPGHPGPSLEGRED